MVRFDILLQTCGSLHPEGEPDDFISEHLGLIRCTRDRDGKVFKVGKAKAYRVHCDLARESGQSLFAVCDAHSQEMHEIHAALFDSDDDLKDEIRGQFDGFDTDILVLDYVLLAPRWRGLRLGLLAARKMVDLLGGGCGLTVSHIAPLNPDADEFLRVPQGWIPRQPSQQEERESRRRLRRHFRRMGFQRIRGTRFHGLSMAQITPTLADLIQPRT